MAWAKENCLIMSRYFSLSAFRRQNWHFKALTLCSEWVLNPLYLNEKRNCDGQLKWSLNVLCKRLGRKGAIVCLFIRPGSPAHCPLSPWPPKRLLKTANGLWRQMWMHSLWEMEKTFLVGELNFLTNRSFFISWARTYHQAKWGNFPWKPMLWDSRGRPLAFQHVPFPCIPLFR